MAVGVLPETVWLLKRVSILLELIDATIKLLVSSFASSQVSPSSNYKRSNNFPFLPEMPGRIASDFLVVLVKWKHECLEKNHCLVELFSTFVGRTGVKVEGCRVEKIAAERFNLCYF